MIKRQLIFSRLSLAILTLGMIGTVLLPQPVLAAVPCAGGTLSGDICKCADGMTHVSFAVDGKNCIPQNTSGAGGIEGSSIWKLLLTIINFLTIGVGIAVVGGISWGGIMYATAQGNPSGTQKGLMIISNSIIGLLLFIFLYAIINYLVPGGLFKS